MRVFTLPVVGIFCGYPLGMGKLPSLGEEKKKMTFKNKIKLILIASNSYIGIIPTNNYLDTQLKKLKFLLKCVV
jgi:hypothetical protein